MPKLLNLYSKLSRTNGLYRLQSRSSSSTALRSSDFSHAVIGAGVIGLSIAQRLQQQSTSTILLEQHSTIGSETSSRNSEVIHSGLLYYPPNSLKAALCVRGKQLLYALCERVNIPFRRTGKWIVAQDMAQMEVLQGLKWNAEVMQSKFPGEDNAKYDDNGGSVRWVSKREALEREPHVRAKAGVLQSASTGIVDSHALMQYLCGVFEETGGTLALQTKVVQIVPVDRGKSGWEIWTTSPGIIDGGGVEVCIKVDTIINAAGLYALPISNMIVPKAQQLQPLYAKGTYYSYSSSKPKVGTLIYPAPVAGHGGLGTHLTIDMGGRIRFGPDLEWIESPTDYAVSDRQIKAAIADIKQYMPSIDEACIALDYCGIRPKLPGTENGFQDFIIRKEPGFEGFVNLLGIESPGLTSALAIGEMVHDLVYK